MSDNRPIGLLDSGVGGLTVARAIMDMLPNETIMYVGDTKRMPYGPKPQEVVRCYTKEIVDYLQRQDVKLVVVACNTATAATLFDNPIQAAVPIVGVIRPAVEQAIALTRSGAIGVIGTQGTVDSRAYDRSLAHQLSQVVQPSDLPPISLASQAAPDLVMFAEQGRTSDPEVLAYTKELLAPLQAQQIDTLILGCTHYPLLTGMIGHVMGPNVALVSSAEATARKVFSYLVDNDVLADNHALPNHEFIATDSPADFALLAKRFLGPRINQTNIKTIAMEM